MTPVQLASAMMMLSGAAHATVNAILKSGRDKMSGRALIDGFSALLVVPAAFAVPLPHGSWGWLALSWLTHLVYLVCLLKAFEQADMSVAYPVARGVVPALAAAVSAFAFEEPVSPIVATGIALVSAGVGLIALGKRVELKALSWAIATGITIALYTVIDAQGVRAAPSAWSYIVWVYLSLGGGIALLFALWRGPRFVATARSEWKPGLVAGALSLLTYGLALGAYRMGETPRLAALREISIVFGVAIAVFVLKERMTRPRLAGVASIASGAVLLLAAG